MSRNRIKATEEAPVTEEVVEAAETVAEPEKEPVKKETPKAKAAKKIKVNGCERLNLRKEASKESEIVQVLVASEILTLIESGEEWTKVKTASGNEGFVMTKFTK